MAFEINIRPVAHETMSPYAKTTMKEIRTSSIRRNNTHLPLLMPQCNRKFSSFSLIIVVIFLTLCSLICLPTVHAGGTYSNGLDSGVRYDQEHIRQTRNIHIAVTIDRNSLSDFLLAVHSAVKAAQNPSKVVIHVVACGVGK